VRAMADAITRMKMNRTIERLPFELRKP